MASKYVDTTAIMQVIGCVYNSPQLLDQEDKYNIVEEDFCEEFHKIVFGAIYKIYMLGAKKITLSSISDFLSTRPKSEAIYMQQKGEEWLTRVSANSDLESFDYYYNRLKKFSLLRAYDNCGIDVTDIYDPDNILDLKKKQIQEDALDNSTLAEIATKIDDRIDVIKTTYIDENETDAVQAGEGLIELLDKYQEVPEIGVPLYGPMINTITKGARLKKFYLRSAPTGVGKAIPMTQEIPTPTGYRQAGDIRLGDYLWGTHGEPVRVIGRYPQKYKNKICIITFEDGRVAKCSKNHLWSVRLGSELQFHTLQTSEMMRKINNPSPKSVNGNKLYIPLAQAVDYEEKKFDIAPYAVGAFMQSERQFKAKYQQDDNLRSQIDSALGLNIRNTDYKNVKPFMYDYKNYFIPQFPEEYLLGSLEQRKELLQGFIDFAGTFNTKTGYIVIAAADARTKDCLAELVYSLGMKCFKKEKYICIDCSPEMKHNLLYTLRYKSILQSYYGTVKREPYKQELRITSIVETEERTNMICFAVNDEEHLYLMNNYIVTHNTRSMAADACFISCDTIFDDDKNDWVQNGIKQPVLYITVEQELNEIQTLMTAFLSNVNETFITNGTYPTEVEKERAYKAAEILSQSPLYIQVFTDFSLQDIENCIKKNIREHGVKYVFSVNEGLCYTFPVHHRGSIY